MCGGRGAENGVIPHACRFRVYSHPIQCIHSFPRAPNRLLAAFPTPPICLLMGWLVCTSVPELPIFRHSFRPSGAHRPSGPGHGPSVLVPTSSNINQAADRCRWGMGRCARPMRSNPSAHAHPTHRCGCMAAWLCGCVAAWLRGCVAVWLRGCVAAWLRGCVAAWLRGCVPVRLCGCAAAWLCGCVAVWLRGCVAAWLRGCAAVWLCGCVAAWLCGCVAVWLCGCVAAAHAHPTHRPMRIQPVGPCASNPSAHAHAWLCGCVAAGLCGCVP